MPKTNSICTAISIQCWIATDRDLGPPVKPMLGQVVISSTYIELWKD